MRTAEAAAAVKDSRCPFTAKCFAVQRKESDVISSFNCKDLLGSHEGMRVVEFSDDGTQLASGVVDKVCLWSISSHEAEVVSGQNPIVPIEMETKHSFSVLSLAFAPGNRRIFSGGFDGNIFIHDVQT